VRTIAGAAPACETERCGPPKRKRFPLVSGAGITIIHQPDVARVTARLVRADRSSATRVGPVLAGVRHSEIRQRLTLPRDLRRANLIEVTTTSSSGSTRTFHGYVTR
jgi:hypothetical protein